MSRGINLLPQPEKKIFDTFIYFILHYFRYIIVITQIVVISVFFLRLYIDQKILDLKKENKHKQQILLITYPLIIQASELEVKTKKIRQILNNQEKITDRFKYITSISPQDIIFDSLSVNDQSLSISGIAVTPQSLLAMKKQLKESQKFQIVSITTLTRLENKSYRFEMTAAYK